MNFYMKIIVYFFTAPPSVVSFNLYTLNHSSLTIPFFLSFFFHPEKKHALITLLLHFLLFYVLLKKKDIDCCLCGVVIYFLFFLRGRFVLRIGGEEINIYRPSKMLMR